ncbi:uncharacterized protein LOC143302112 [Babylonia areolata]|uniref:uncharacterized protein LOC143302112 n=1 Tax=Babylonia areolata TaxID=304850 RepID=UPI003FD26A85
MSSRRHRSESQLESSSRDITDSFYSLGRIFTDRNVRFVKKIRVANQIESAPRPRSSSFSVVDDHLGQHAMRRSSVSRHRHGFPGLPVRATSPMYSYLPGVAVGYRRLWMQGNPWPDRSSKETGSRRDGGQDHPHRIKFRDHRRHHQGYAFYPGGDCHDPLNLKAAGLGEDMQYFSASPIPAPDPDRYMPVNNFIPTNRRDPLGLTQEEDNLMPIAMKYPLRFKRKRSRKPRKDNVQGDSSASISQSSIDGTEGISATSNTVSSASSGIARDSGQSDNFHSSTVAGDSNIVKSANSEKGGECDMVTDDEDVSGDDRIYSDSGKKPAAIENTGILRTFPESSEDNSVSSGAGTRVNQAAGDAGESCSSIGTSTQSGTGQANENIVHKSGSDTDQHPVSDDRTGSIIADDNETLEQGKRGPAVSFRTRSTSLSQSKHGSETGRKMKHELDQKLREIQKQELSLKHLYPVPQSPLDDEDREHVARNRKSLKKALRIEPIKPEEQAKVNKEREKKEREFKRQWRYPNLKSPEENNEERTADQQSSAEALRIEVDPPPAETRQDNLQHGQISRTEDTVVSPVMRPDPGQIRKRRRTVSECSIESASKKLVFRRSSSPDVRGPSPRKLRRQSSGSGQTEQGSTVQEKQQSTVKFAKNPAYKHGNYYRYYGYRTPAMAPDFRLYFFKKEWFEGNDVLDVGCNAGDVTLAVAQIFHPKKIVGMDIDPNLIRIARQNIRSHQTKANMYQMEKYPVSTNDYGPIEPLPALTNQSNIFPKNVMFMQGNYVLKSDKELDHVKEEYDTILALSITKWIHLNHGDEGLKRVFHRMFQQLRPGGRLVLEPQTWASYRRRKKLSATIYKNYNSIRLKPNDFADYLVDTVGFCKRIYLGQPFNPSKGFQRPLWLFIKYKGTTENTPSPEGCSTMEPPPPSQYTIRERMTYLAGYSPIRTSPLPYLGLHPDYIRPPGFRPGFGFSKQRRNPWGEGTSTMNYEDDDAEDQNRSSHTDTSSQREGGESFNSSSDGSASSSGVNESHNTSSTSTCGSSQDMGGGGSEGGPAVMEWEEEEEEGEGGYQLQDDLAEQHLQQEEMPAGLCNGDIHHNGPGHSPGGADVEEENVPCNSDDEPAMADESLYAGGADSLAGGEGDVPYGGVEDDVDGGDGVYVPDVSDMDIGGVEPPPPEETSSAEPSSQNQPSPQKNQPSPQNQTSLQIQQNEPSISGTAKPVMQDSSSFPDTAQRSTSAIHPPVSHPGARSPETRAPLLLTLPVPSGPVPSSESSLEASSSGTSSENTGLSDTLTDHEPDWRSFSFVQHPEVSSSQEGLQTPLSHLGDSSVAEESTPLDHHVFSQDVPSVGEVPESSGLPSYISSSSAHHSSEAGDESLQVSPDSGGPSTHSPPTQDTPSAHLPSQSPLPEPSSQAVSSPSPDTAE